MGSGVLTTIDLVRTVVTVKVTVTAPQLEGTVSISTGELIRLTGRRGPCADQAGVSQRSSDDQDPVPTLPSYAVLTAVQFVAAIPAVFLPVTEVVSGDAMPVAARGLLGSTGYGPGNTG